MARPAKWKLGPAMRPVRSNSCKPRHDRLHSVGPVATQAPRRLSARPREQNLIGVAEDDGGVGDGVAGPGNQDMGVHPCDKGIL